MDYVVRTSREDRFVISEYCPERPYLEIQLPENVTHVEKLIVNITSHDQGFCSDESLKGKGGFTWFEANVVTPSGRNTIPRQLLARNLAGISRWQSHQACLEISTLNTSVRHFLDEIRGGDIIQLLPKARWQCWLNFIRAADMEMHCRSIPSLEVIDLACEIPSYNQLDRARKSIRLLALHPGSGNNSIFCELLSHHLLDGDETEFEALSYCWGNRMERKTIHLHQPNDITKVIQVTSSLHGALLHLRKPDATRILWVDAISINQSDSEECADQVSMMGEIYTRAKDVIVWLGEANDDTRAAANTLRNIFAYFQVPTEEELARGLSRGSFPPLKGVAFDGSRIEETFNSDHIGLYLEQMSRFFAIPWFWRVWVVQEAWLSKKTIFYCGEDVISWDSIWRANVWMNIHGFNMPGFEQKALPLIWTRLKRLQEHTEHSKESLRLGLLELVLQGLDLKATDPRDKLFGLIGLAEETYCGQMSASDALIYPSYSKSTSTVFADFTKWWIQKHKSLKILSAIHATHGRTWQSLHCTDGPEAIVHGSPPSDHPSWAFWHSGHSKWANELLGFSSLYTASGDSEANLEPVTVIEPSAELRLRGIRLDTIVSIKPFKWFDSDEDLRGVFNRLFDASGARRIWNNPVSSGLQLNEAGWDGTDRHLIGHWGHYIRGLEAEAEEDEESDDEGEENEEKDRASSQKGPEDTVESEDDAETNQSATSDSNLVPYFSCLDDCLFKTKNGSLGLCPAGTKIGDTLAVLFGGSVPYIVRKKSKGDDNKYQFVGECFVQGMMNGSALEPTAGVKPVEEDFTLI